MTTATVTPTDLPPAIGDILDAVHNISPKGQLTPEATQQLVDLATRLEAGAQIYDLGLPAIALLLVGACFHMLHWHRTAAACALLGFGLLSLVPIPVFMLMGVLGCVFSLVAILRTTPGVPVKVKALAGVKK